MSRGHHEHGVRARCRLRGERGANMLEYVGLVVLVGGVVSVLMASSGLQVVPDGFRAAVCQVVNPGGNCQTQAPQKLATGPGATENFRPKKCQVSETAGKYGQEITVGPIDIGMEYKAVTKRNSDGSITVTLVDGPTASAGGQFNIGKAGNTVDPNGSQGGGEGTVKLQYGDTYRFKNQAEYDKFKKRLNAEMTMDLAKYSPGPGYAMGAAMKQEKVGEMPPPEVTFSKTTLEGAGSFQGSATGTEGSSGVTPELAGQAQVKVARDVIVMHDREKGEESHIYQLSIEGQAGGGPGGSKQVRRGSEAAGQVVGGEGKAKRAGSMKVTRDSKTGELKSIEFVQTTELTGSETLGGSGEVQAGQRAGVGGTAEYKNGKTRTHVTTTKLEFKKGDDRQRRIAEKWLASHGKNSTTLNIGAGGMIPTTKPGPDASEFERVMYNNAQVSDTSYNGSTQGGKLGWSLTWYATIGMEIGMDVSKKQVAQAQYLGAPQSGERTFVDFKGCQSAGG